MTPFCLRRGGVRAGALPLHPRRALPGPARGTEFLWTLPPACGAGAFIQFSVSNGRAKLGANSLRKSSASGRFNCSMDFAIFCFAAVNSLLP